MQPSGVWMVRPRRDLSFEEFVDQSPPVDGFAKVVRGLQGIGAFTLRLMGGEAWVNGKKVSPQEIADRVVGARFRLQERVVQHAALDALHAPSVNTVRITTLLRDGQVELVGSTLRLGAGGSHVDNWSAGGLIVGLDLGSGALFGKGIRDPEVVRRTRAAAVVDCHPDSGV